MTVADVTVCIPSIPPREPLLQRALASVAAQTVQPKEVNVHVDHEGVGAAHARNRTWENADTTWVAFLDDDDELTPFHLEVLLRCAEENPGADLVYPWFHSMPSGFDPLACPVNGELVNPFGIPFGSEQRHHILYVGNFIPVTVLVRLELVRAVGGYPDTTGTDMWGINEDYYFLRACLEAGATFVHHPERTWIWHHHGGNTSGRKWNR